MRLIIPILIIASLLLVAGCGEKEKVMDNESDMTADLPLPPPPPPIGGTVGDTAGVDTAVDEDLIEDDLDRALGDIDLDSW